jgi:hypothetical protein
MFWLKPVFAGIAAGVIGTVLAVIVIGAWVFSRFSGNGGDDNSIVGWDPISMFRQSIIPWLVYIAFFALGFYLQYRRQT